MQDLEQWNMKNKKLYEVYFNLFTEESHSLEQAQFLSYIEMYSKTNDAYSYVRTAKYSSETSLAKLVQTLDANWHPSFAQHKRLYRDTINQILSCTLDGLTLDICIDPQVKNTRKKAYVITKADLMFFNFLFVTHQSDDAQNLITGGYDHYDQISEDYYKLLKLGLKTLISSHTSNYTNEDIEFCFEYKFGKARKKLLAKLDYLNGITSEIANFELNGKEIIPTYKECEAILEEAEAKLMKLRGNFFDGRTKSILVKLGIITENS